MFTVTSCPTVNDCSNPAALDKSNWALIYADSQENDRLAIHAFDNDPSTFWHTKWRSSKPVHPHEIQIDLPGYPHLCFYNRVTIIIGDK